jgi:hypothetical protein
MEERVSLINGLLRGRRSIDDMCIEKDEEKESRDFSGFLVRVEKKRLLQR